MKKRYFISALAILLPGLLKAQTSLSGVINRYAKVEEVDFCAARLRVATTDGFQPGMNILIMQMQGAVIRGDNSGSFGEITDLGNAGRYEEAIIESISGNTFQLRYSLLHNYDAEGSVQIISLPEYENAVVSAPLTAQPWDGGTGGVIALRVNGTLTLPDGVAADVSFSDFR